MATPVPDYKFTETRGATAIYPWDQWLDGQSWRLVRKVDFFITLSSMKNYIYIMARKRGLKAKIAVEGDVIYMKATPR